MHYIHIQNSMHMYHMYIISIIIWNFFFFKPIPQKIFFTIQENIIPKWSYKFVKRFLRKNYKSSMTSINLFVYLFSFRIKQIKYHSLNFCYYYNYQTNEIPVPSVIPEVYASTIQFWNCSIILF